MDLTKDENRILMMSAYTSYKAHDKLGTCANKVFTTMQQLDSDFKTFVTDNESKTADEIKKQYLSENT